MEILNLTLAANLLEKLSGIASTGGSILWAAVGLGLVIFFHEMGHFAVAKWCNVNVERFSIGFGPVLFSRKWGETEYALSLIPFGGYVKMLGQDDADPSQLTNEEIAEDPRSYLAKNVWQRMAIISAGVTMNIITAVMFVGGAFALGVDLPPNVIGGTRPGMPAWVAGLKSDDTIEKINGRVITTFDDVRLNVAVQTHPLTIEGLHKDRSTFTLTVQPDTGKAAPQIGVAQLTSLKVLTDPKGKVPFVFAGTAAARAEPAFERGDVIAAVGGEPVKTYSELTTLLASQTEGPLKLEVWAGGDKTKSKTVTVTDNVFRTLGLSMDTGPITAVQEGSVADNAGLLKGDKLASINGRIVGTEINPLKLPNEFARLHGQVVSVTVTRQSTGGPQTEVTLTLEPENIPGWTEQPLSEGDPLSIPAIGVAFHTIPIVLAVEPDSPAARANIKAGSLTKVKRITLVLPKEITESDGEKKRELPVELDEEKGEKKSNNWGYAFWLMQEFPQRTVKLTLTEGTETREVELIPQLDPTWPQPVVQGLRMHPDEIKQIATTPGEVWFMATNYTRNSAISIYLTLRGLLTGQVKKENLSGPLGIANVAVQIVNHSVPQFLMFLAFLSVNLAVLNFLPIPVLDGGHMVFLLWEAVTRRRPSEKIVIGASYIGMAFLLSLMVFVIYLDIGRLFMP
ncbi:MAG: site-2 protease family protein [Planctomycetota bacterium]